MNTTLPPPTGHRSSPSWYVPRPLSITTSSLASWACNGMASPGPIRSKMQMRSRTCEPSSAGGSNTSAHSVFGRWSSGSPTIVSYAKRSMMPMFPIPLDPCSRRMPTMDEPTQARGRRTGGREGRRAARLHEVVEKVPFITRTLTPFEVLSEEGLATIEHNADTILETVGIEFRESPDALKLLEQAGCEVQEER